MVQLTQYGAAEPTGAPGFRVTGWRYPVRAAVADAAKRSDLRDGTETLAASIGRVTSLRRAIAKSLPPTIAAAPPGGPEVGLYPTPDHLVSGTKIVQ
jgi:hypothetical protein